MMVELDLRAVVQPGVGSPHGTVLCARTQPRMARSGPSLASWHPQHGESSARLFSTQQQWVGSAKSICPAGRTVPVLTSQ